MVFYKNSKSNSFTIYYAALHKIYMIRYIPDWTFKALCLISTILMLLINVNVGRVGTSLSDWLERVSCVIYGSLGFTNTSQWLSCLTGFTHDSHSWHCSTPVGKVPAGIVKCLHQLFVLADLDESLHRLHLLLYSFWHKYLLSLGCVLWFKYSSITKKVELAV